MSEPIVTATQARDFAIGIIRASTKYDAFDSVQMAAILISAMDFSAQNIEEQVDMAMEAMKKDMDQYGCLYQANISNVISPEAAAKVSAEGEKQLWHQITCDPVDCGMMETCAMNVGQGVLFRETFDNDHDQTSVALAYVPDVRVQLPATCGARTKIVGRNKGTGGPK